MNQFEATIQDLPFGMSNPDAMAARVAKPQGYISTPQEVAALAQALQDNRASFHKVGPVSCYDARYNHRADQVDSGPVTLDVELLNKALDLVMVMPEGDDSPGARALKGLVDVPKQEWKAFPSNSLIQEVVDRYQERLSAQKVPSSALAATIDALFANHTR